MKFWWCILLDFMYTILDLSVLIFSDALVLTQCQWKLCRKHVLESLDELEIAKMYPILLSL